MLPDLYAYYSMVLGLKYIGTAQMLPDSTHITKLLALQTRNRRPTVPGSSRATW